MPLYTLPLSTEPSRSPPQPQSRCCRSHCRDSVLEAGSLCMLFWLGLIYLNTKAVYWNVLPSKFVHFLILRGEKGITSQNMVFNHLLKGFIIKLLQVDGDPNNNTGMFHFFVCNNVHTHIHTHTQTHFKVQGIEHCESDHVWSPLCILCLGEKINLWTNIIFNDVAYSE